MQKRIPLTILLLILAFSASASSKATPQWVQTSANFGTPIVSLASDTSGAIIAITRDHIFRSADSGTNWTDITGTFENLSSLTIITTNNLELVVGMRLNNNSGAVYKSSDGTSWQKIFVGEAVLSVSSGSLGIFIGTVDGLYSNPSGSWERVLSSVQLTDVIQFASGDVYAATNGGVFHSVDSGRTFAPANGPITTIHKLAAIDSSLVFAQTVLNGLIARTTDRGRTWDTLLTGQAATNGAALGIDSANAIYAASSTIPNKTLTRSIDSGAHWKDMTTGITDPIFTSFAASHKYIYTSTTSGHVFRLQTFFEPPPKSVRVQSPRSAAVVWPNPAKERLRVEYTLDEPGQVTFSLFDLLGRQVYSHSSSALSAGRHSMTVELGKLAPGEYIYRVQSGGRETSGKLEIHR